MEATTPSPSPTAAVAEAAIAEEAESFLRTSAAATAATTTITPTAAVAAKEPTRRPVRMLFSAEHHHQHHHHHPRRKVLILYTGGTIGMRRDAATGTYVPDATFLEEQLAGGQLLPAADPAMPLLAYSAFDPPLDSSDMNQTHWAAIARAIGEEYGGSSGNNYDGFVVVHGTDTMAYTASAVSFALEGLGKPVVFTGSQIPLCAVRTDGLQNLVDSVLVAAHAGPALAEVVIVFDNLIMRGNRTTKLKAWGISGFKSFNYPPLGEGGVKLVTFDRRAISAPPPQQQAFRCRPFFSRAVAVLSVFPGIEHFAAAMLESLVDGAGVRGIVFEAFGIGNAPSSPQLLDAISAVCAKGVIVVVVSKCPSGSVSLGAYSGGYSLGNAGCTSGSDMTTEAAFAKLSWLLAPEQGLDPQQVRSKFEEDLRGEVTPGFFIHHNRHQRVLA